ncbi:MAG: hypothetical protein J4224_01080 [Candidatus Diapherotrites archaeon]|uniref:Uncharacterized protein n=1 Tax=Candidatus Iainarchaeum sp. TaxID=3101447 RepID=A0A7J4IT67_9ARCH|nr:MAG: hypothetical protein QT03_C0001G0679 [archaeon GW2011_AR10]MBS3058999.1 hypothetical protein [Candidatus Diapherotrites archaeon]HIH08020.1 hypothetical protein [Candidatus Diapherotrites archaeon]
MNSGGQIQQFLLIGVVGIIGAIIIFAIAQEGAKLIPSAGGYLWGIAIAFAVAVGVALKSFFK